MPGPMPSIVSAARQAWSDLVATTRQHPLLAVLAIVTCTATSLVNAQINPPEDASTFAIARGFALAFAEAFAMTPLLLACHRYVILGEVMRDYAGTLTTRRFWRFFVLTGAILALLFVPVLLTRPFFSVATTGWVLLVGVAAFIAASSVLALLFPAVAVDAPGIGLKNAVADLRGNVWRIFLAGTLTILLPMLALGMVVGVVQALLFEDPTSWPVRLAFAPFEGAVVAATYVLLVLIASRFYLATADRLAQVPNS